MENAKDLDKYHIVRYRAGGSFDARNLRFLALGNAGTKKFLTVSIG